MIKLSCTFVPLDERNNDLKQQPMKVLHVLRHCEQAKKTFYICISSIICMHNHEQYAPQCKHETLLWQLPITNSVSAQTHASIQCLFNISTRQGSSIICVAATVLLSRSTHAKQILANRFVDLFRVRRNLI